ncbi:sugar ABC transporter permease [Boudabousia liubingyangii]|uniref:Sugar ABC transporter permease n=1 Tax=Boudabousia liubingyangii TaxID=1921764 RepID=A0A1Q5PL06_9ACTO|nr:ABC transporter permease [Boudabousia liubingyangii]OKL46387.1 sugar ABC transporter permease [Boudabousia liubingyangii]OKL47291.1 sugar ABC transporter permease [Boudabousia liubingyangii]
MASKSSIEKEFWTPGISPRLTEIFKRRYLLNLLVHKELRVRYRGSFLGMLWSYAKPAVQFIVFYVALGVFLAQNRAIENYVVYLFSGVVVVNYFSEIFNNTTRSIVWNAPLVKKIYLPRQLFPVSSLCVAVVHLIPQLVILVLGALIYGWRPGFYELGLGILGFMLVSIFALGLGLFTSAINVMFRDAENFVDLILMVVTWASPVLYKWQDVHRILGGTIWWWIYMLNPITPIVLIFHRVFWFPTAGVGGVSPVAQLPENMYMWVGICALISFLMLLIGDWYFRHLDGRFAQEL